MLPENAVKWTIAHPYEVVFLPALPQNLQIVKSVKESGRKSGSTFTSPFLLIQKDKENGKKSGQKVRRMNDFVGNKKKWNSEYGIPFYFDKPMIFRIILLLLRTWYYHSSVFYFT